MILRSLEFIIPILLATIAILINLELWLKVISNVMFPSTFEFVPISVYLRHSKPLVQAIIIFLGPWFAFIMSETENNSICKLTINGIIFIRLIELIGS